MQVARLAAERVARQVVQLAQLVRLVER